MQCEQRSINVFTYNINYSQSILTYEKILGLISEKILGGKFFWMFGNPRTISISFATIREIVIMVVNQTLTFCIKKQCLGFKEEMMVFLPVLVHHLFWFTFSHIRSHPLRDQNVSFKKICTDCGVKKQQSSTQNIF